MNTTLLTADDVVRAVIDLRSRRLPDARETSTWLSRVRAAMLGPDDSPSPPYERRRGVDVLLAAPGNDPAAVATIRAALRADRSRHQLDTVCAVLLGLAASRWWL